ncbi:UNVERIFIED_ORG: hypothetical protein GGD58_002745 [Rhizobium pisi]
MLRRLITSTRDAVARVLIPDAAGVLKRAWSLRLIELAAIADVILNVVPVIGDYLPWWLTLALLGGAYVARLLIQKKEPANGDKA